VELFFYPLISGDKKKRERTARRRPLAKPGPDGTPKNKYKNNWLCFEIM
jgi:hypothetical protein